jgi:hypothetical protein
MDTSVKVSMTSRFHAFKNSLSGRNSNDESSFHEDLRRFKDLQRRIEGLPKAATRFFEAVREATEAGYMLAHEFEKFEVDAKDPNRTALRKLCEAQRRLFTPKAERVAAVGILRPVDAFSEALDDAIPAIEDLLADRRDKHAVYSLYKHKLDKACRAARRAREKRRILAWNSTEDLEQEVVRKQQQFENAKSLFDAADRRLHNALCGIKGQQTAMIRNACAAIVSMRRGMSEGGLELMAEVAEKLPTTQAAMKAYKPRPASVRASVVLAGVFGVPLVTLSQEAESQAAGRGGRGTSAGRRMSLRVAALGVPAVVGRCMFFLRSHGMRHEGLFRIPGDMKLVASLKARYDRGETVQLAALAGDGGPESLVNSVSTLLKMFFRELPEPLFPHAAYSPLLSLFRDARAGARGGGGGSGARDEAEAASLVAAVRAVLTDEALVPEPHRVCAAYLFRFLAEVSGFSDENKMTPKNLGVCWAPSLLRPCAEKAGPVDPQALMALQADAQPSIACIEFLIEQSAQVFHGEAFETDGAGLGDGIAAAFDDEEEGISDASDESDRPDESDGSRSSDPGFAGGGGVPSADAFAAMDLNGDGKVDRGEFLEWRKTLTPSRRPSAPGAGLVSPSRAAAASARRRGSARGLSPAEKLQRSASARRGSTSSAASSNAASSNAASSNDDRVSLGHNKRALAAVAAFEAEMARRDALSDSEESSSDSESSSASSTPASSPGLRARSGTRGRAPPPLPDARLTPPAVPLSRHGSARSTGSADARSAARGTARNGSPLRPQPQRSASRSPPKKPLLMSASFKAFKRKPSGRDPGDGPTTAAAAAAASRKARLSAGGKARVAASPRSPASSPEAPRVTPSPGRRKALPALPERRTKRKKKHKKRGKKHAPSPEVPRARTTSGEVMMQA